MLCTDIVSTLMRYIPRVSESFSEYITPSAVSVLGDTVTVTAANHGIKNNQPVSITHSETENLVTSITTVSDGVTLTTTSSHDLTTDWPGSATVTLRSVTDSSVDGTYSVTRIDSGTSFTIPSFAETGLTDVYLYEAIDYGIDGLFNVTVVDVDTFTYELDFGETIDPGFTLDIYPESVRVHNDIRITGTNSIERFLQSYEKSCAGKNWLVVELGNQSVSKGSRTQTDATREQSGFATWRIEQPQPFAVSVIVPCNETTGRKARDTVEAERPNIYKSLLGMKFDTGFVNGSASAVTPEDDGESTYNKAYYVHELRFSQLARITNDDRLFTQRTTPFRAIQIDFYHEDTDNDNVIMELSAELDN